MKSAFISFILFLFAYSTLAQNKVQVDSLLREVQIAKKDSQKVELLTQLAWEFVDFNQEKGKAYAGRALSLSQKTGNKQGEASAYNVLALCFELSGHLDTAFVLYNEAYEKRMSMKDYKGASAVLLNIGAANFLQGYYNLALKNYLNSAYLLKKNSSDEDNATLSKVYNNIGLIHRTKKEYEEAIRWYLQSLEIKKKLGDQRGILNSFMNLSMTYQNTKDYISASKYTDSALYIAQEKGWDEEYSGLYTNQASILFNQNNKEKAAKIIAKAFEWLDKIPDAKTKVYTHYTAGEIAFGEKKYTLAIDDFLKCISLAQSQNKREVLQSAYALLARCYAQANDYKSAYLANLKHQAISDSIFNMESKRSLDEQQIIFNVKESEDKIIQLNTENRKKEVERENAERRFGLSVIFSIVSLLGAVVLIILWKKNKEKNKILNQKNLIIEESLQEKETLLKEIHHRVKNNLQIITGLLELQESLQDDTNIGNLVSEAQGRIRTMAIIHEMLYLHNDLGKIDVANYVLKLANYIKSEFKRDRQVVDMNIEIGKVYFNIDTIIPLGLILNELLTNVFKYAFAPESVNHLNISISPLEQRNWQLKVADNGVGIKDYENQLTQGSFGLQLIKMLVRQLRGKIEYHYEEGSIFLISFEEQKV